MIDYAVDYVAPFKWNGKPMNKIECRLFRFGKSKMDLYRDLKGWIDCSYSSMCHVILNFNPRSRKMKLIMRQIEMQLLIYEHEIEETAYKRKIERGTK